MRVFPAIDLRDGACVQLVGGSSDAEKIRVPDPVEVAHRWKTAGFQALHLVDLDAALGTGSNATVIADDPRRPRASRPRSAAGSATRTRSSVSSTSARAGSSSAPGRSRIRSGWRRWPSSFPGS